jgi:hypothetical protein
VAKALAASLVERGIPSVIGMQSRITNTAAVTLAGRLYDALTDGFPVDVALAHAREAVWAVRYDIESRYAPCCSVPRCG